MFRGFAAGPTNRRHIIKLHIDFNHYVVDVTDNTVNPYHYKLVDLHGVVLYEHQHNLDDEHHSDLSEAGQHEGAGSERDA